MVVAWIRDEAVVILPIFPVSVNNPRFPRPSPGRVELQLDPGHWGKRAHHPSAVAPHVGPSTVPGMRWLLGMLGWSYGAAASAGCPSARALDERSRITMAAVLRYAGRVDVASVVCQKSQS
jgi:hypothetical protein